MTVGVLGDVSVTAALTGELALGDAYSKVLEIARPLLPVGSAIIPLVWFKLKGWF